MASLVEGEVEDLTLVAYVIMHMLYLGTSHSPCVQDFLFPLRSQQPGIGFRDHD